MINKNKKTTFTSLKEWEAAIILPEYVEKKKMEKIKNDPKLLTKYLVDKAIDDLRKNLNNIIT